MLFDRTTEMVKKMIQLEKHKIHIAVDATLGNGNDALFLSEILEDPGHIYAFDVQEKAITISKDMLEGLGINNVTYINDGHEHLSKYVSSADLIMFNLGYLPRGDHKIKTHAETTVEALKSAVEILTPGGLISIISYYRHEGGAEEKIAVEKYMSQLDPSLYDVIEIISPNKENDPPIVYLLRTR